MTKQKTKEVERLAVIDEILKKYGDGAITYQTDEVKPIDVISFGCLAVDHATGVGGAPRGRFTELISWEGMGKTTLCLQAVARTQRAGLLAAYIDMEHALDLEYAEMLGVDVKAMPIAQPFCGEEALAIAEMLIRSGKFATLIIDSIAALVPRAEVEGEMGDSHMGLHARLMSQACRKLSPIVQQNNVAVILTNQKRLKIGVSFGNPETTTGGNAMKFYASLRMDISGTTKIKDGADVSGTKKKLTVIKNKVAPPFKVAEFDLVFGEGTSYLGEIVDLGSKYGLITKRSASYSMGEDKIGVGRATAMAWMKEHPQVVESLEASIRTEMAKDTSGITVAREVDDDGVILDE